MTTRWDFFALTGTVLAVVVLITYLVVIDAQGDNPAYWFVAVVFVVASGGMYASRKDSPARKPVLLGGALILFGLGLLALLSVGPPLLLASGFLFVAGLRHHDDLPLVES